jgi:hypothetical protein
MFSVKTCIGVIVDMEPNFWIFWQHVTGTPSNFLFNMDEMGHQESADAHSKVCIVTASHAGDLVYYPVSLAEKRITLIASCAADGSYIKPAVIVARKTFEDDELAKAFFDRDTLEGWFETTFTPDAARHRKRFSDKSPVFLLLDNCTAH